MDYGFIFKTNKKLYFIATKEKKRTKKIAKIFLDFFLSRYNGETTSEIIQNTFNTIYNNMYNATVKRSDDFTKYFIHTKYSGETINENKIVFIVE